jgi:hypothetical protein
VTRTATAIPTEILRFQNALRIYSTKEAVHQYNHNRMRDLRKPVIVISATHQGQGAANTSTEDAGNVHTKLPIAIGCRIMLTENLWVERGLVNVWHCC